MPLKAGDPARFADILHAAVIAERLFMRIQFDAETPEEIERALNARRQAIGLRKAIEEWPTTATVPTAAT